MIMICNVPDEVVKSVKMGTWCGSSVVEKIIANGIPLPKGHGRIGDLDAISLDDINFFSIGDYCKMARKLTDAPTIIEADKAETGEE